MLIDAKVNAPVIVRVCVPVPVNDPVTFPPVIVKFDVEVKE
jgi:hypothetical protein